jgi:soluble lytic murein transglycosylase-like protein
MRWRDENLYDPAIARASERYGVPIWAIKGLIAHESGFNPLAVKVEVPRPSLPPTPDFPKGGDESRGLTQTLVRTARSYNFAGDKDGLYNPDVSIDIGTRVLRDNLQRAKGRLDIALAAYNGGWSNASEGDARRVNGPDSPFTNQDYVDRVLSYADYFRTTYPATQRSGSLPVKVGPGVNPWIVVGGVVLLLGAAYIVYQQQRHYSRSAV